MKKHSAALAALLTISAAAGAAKPKTAPKPKPKTAAKPAAKPVAKPAAKPTAKPVAKPATPTTPVAPPVAKPAPAPAAPAAYVNDLQKLAPGKLPDEFMVLGGDFVVAKADANVLLELPGEPVDAFGLLYGPTHRDSASAKLRAFGTSEGRRKPAFTVGIFGVSGYKLRVNAAAEKLELLRDEEVKNSIPFTWKNASWTWLRLQAVPVGKEWKVSGRVWEEGTPEPDKWQIEWSDHEAPPPGRASLLGMPYAGTPLHFDDLSSEKPAP